MLSTLEIKDFVFSHFWIYMNVFDFDSGKLIGRSVEMNLS